MKRRYHRRRDDGQVVITFALTMALFLFGMIALVIDISTLYAARATAIEAAQDGAVAGASDVDISAFVQTGSVKLNASAGAKCQKAAAADAAAFSSFGASASTPTCYNPPGKPNMDVSVKLTIQLPVPLPAFGSSGSVKGCYTAAAQGGTTIPFPEAGTPVPTCP